MKFQLAAKIKQLPSLPRTILAMLLTLTWIMTAIPAPVHATTTKGSLPGDSSTTELTTIGVQFLRLRFTTHVDYNTIIPSYTVAIGDLNGDGKAEMVTANGYNDNISVFINSTTTNVITPTFSIKVDYTSGPSGKSPYSIAIGDLNADSKLDLAIANAQGNTVSVLLNTTTSGATLPSFHTYVTFATGKHPIAIALADMNQDGKLDLVTANTDDGTVSLLRNTTANGAAIPSFAAHADFDVNPSPYSVAVGDLNQDSAPDIAVTNYISYTVTVLLNTTAAAATTFTFSSKFPFGTGVNPSDVAVGDFNNDGKPDLAATNYISNNMSVLRNLTAVAASTPDFASMVNFGAGVNPTSLCASDLTGDGKPDLISANYGSNNISLLRNTTVSGSSTITFTRHTDFATGFGPNSIALGYLNSDGLLDVATSNTISNTVSILANKTYPKPYFFPLAGR